MITIINKTKYFLVLIAIALASFLAIVSTANAQVSDVLDIEFQNGNNMPLFNEASFLPGDSVTRWVDVMNVGGASQIVAAKSEQVSNQDSLAEILNLEISHNSIVVFDDTLANFFSLSSLDLSSISSGELIRYYFSIGMDDSTGNNYQEKTLGFDIVIGENGEGGNGPTNGPSSFSRSTRIVPVNTAVENATTSLWIEKRSNSIFANPGQKLLEYFITVKNNGSIDIVNATIVDVLPIGLVFAESGNREKTWFFESIPEGEFKQLAYLVNVDDDARMGIYTNKVSVSASNHGEVSTTSDLMVEEIMVLGVQFESTGFSNAELVFVIFLLIPVVAISSNLKKKKLQ